MSKAHLTTIGCEHIDDCESVIIERQFLESLVPYMAIVPSFSYSAGSRCQEKGLLPGHLLAALEVLQFLSCTVLSAQKAQRLYGIRASVLLAMALDEFSFDANNLLKDGKLLNDYSGERSISPQVNDPLSGSRTVENVLNGRLKACLIVLGGVTRWVRGRRRRFPSTVPSWSRFQLRLRVGASMSAGITNPARRRMRNWSFSRSFFPPLGCTSRG